MSFVNSFFTRLYAIIPTTTGYTTRNRVSMSIPIVLPITDFTKFGVEKSGKPAVALTTKDGVVVAILRNPEIYKNRKEEIVTRTWGVIDPGHPYIKHIYSGGDWLLGGEVELLGRIKYNDGLDQYRLTAKELVDEFVRRGADAVFAFQTRNPTHAGHAYLMKTAREKLIAKGAYVIGFFGNTGTDEWCIGKHLTAFCIQRNNLCYSPSHLYTSPTGYKNPVLWLSPLGGWTKRDDVPLDVRVKQHVAVLNEGMLDPKTTVMAIWPAPMIYAGPTEVIFHAKSRRNAGAGFFVVGRDPAGVKGSPEAATFKEDDLYHPDHGRYVLQTSPGLGEMELVAFQQVKYDKRDHTMKTPDPKRPVRLSEWGGSHNVGSSLVNMYNKPDVLDLIAMRLPNTGRLHFHLGKQDAPSGPERCGAVQLAHAHRRGGGELRAAWLYGPYGLGDRGGLLPECRDQALGTLEPTDRGTARGLGHGRGRAVWDERLHRLPQATREKHLPLARPSPKSLARCLHGGD